MSQKAFCRFLGIPFRVGANSGVGVIPETERECDIAAADVEGLGMAITGDAQLNLTRRAVEPNIGGCAVVEGQVIGTLRSIDSHDGCNLGRGAEVTCVHQRANGHGLFLGIGNPVLEQAASEPRVAFHGHSIGVRVQNHSRFGVDELRTAPGAAASGTSNCGRAVTTVSKAVIANENSDKLLKSG